MSSEALLSPGEVAPLKEQTATVRKLGVRGAGVLHIAHPLSARAHTTHVGTHVHTSSPVRVHVPRTALPQCAPTP